MKKRWMMLLAAVCLTVLFLFAGRSLPVSADETTPVEVSSVSQLGQACQKDDAYVVLTKDIVATTNHFILYVGGDNVTLDCKGYTLGNTADNISRGQGGVIDVMGKNFTLRNATLQCNTPNAVAVHVSEEGSGVRIFDTNTSGSVGSFLFSESEEQGLYLVTACDMDIDQESILPGLRVQGSQALVVSYSSIFQGGNNMSSATQEPLSTIPAIEIRDTAELTFTNSTIEKKVGGEIIQFYHVDKYTTYGSFVPPDGQISMNGTAVSPTKELYTGVQNSLPVTESVGYHLQVLSNLTPIVDVSCTIPKPKAQDKVAFTASCSGDEYEFKEISWSYEDGEGASSQLVPVAQGDRYLTGKAYRMSLTLQALDGYYFANGVPGLLNGEAPDACDSDQENFHMYHRFPEMEALIGWQKIDGNWYYIHTNGTYAKGWKKLNDVWYYFSEEGVMQTGWQKIDGKWYHFASSGAMQTGWQKLGTNWYYFASGGAMQTGWKQISGKWYYFNSDGDMVTGWKKLSGTWYYFNSSGVMQTGWQTISGKTYYFKSSGAMAAKEWCKGYWLNADGTWTYKYKASWKQDSKGWYYQDTSGWYAKSTTIKIDDKMYTFDAKGYMK